MICITDVLKVVGGMLKDTYRLLEILNKVIWR